MIWHADELNWNRAFEYAKEFYEEYGHLRIEKDYYVEDFNLGLWIQSQRRLKIKSATEMTLQKVARLDSIGMIWDVKDYVWETNVSLSRQYFEQNGDLLIPQDYVVQGVNLGSWIGNLSNSKKGSGSIELTEERISVMESMGMIWDVNEYLWEQHYLLAKEFYEENGHLNIPRNYSVGKWNVGYWLKNQKKADKKKTLREDRKEKLVKIGFN